MEGMHCIIGLEGKDGTINAIFCQYCGDVHRTGRILFNNYRDASMVKELVNLKNQVAKLGEKLEESEISDDLNDLLGKTYRDKTEFLEAHSKSNIDYIYLFTREGNKEYRWQVLLKKFMDLEHTLESPIA